MTMSILDKDDVKIILENIDNLLLLLIHADKLSWQRKEELMSNLINEIKGCDSP